MALVPFDVHALVEGRPFILGGLEIPHEKGLQGHSDADVLLHAVMDALLGALALEILVSIFRSLMSDTEGQIAANCCVMCMKRSENLASP